MVMSQDPESIKRVSGGPDRDLSGDSRECGHACGGGVAFREGARITADQQSFSNKSVACLPDYLHFTARRNALLRDPIDQLARAFPASGGRGETTAVPSLIFREARSKFAGRDRQQTVEALTHRFLAAEATPLSDSFDGQIRAK
jgi:hypothetical protein